jgi:hypothetical protein
VKHSGFGIFVPSGAQVKGSRQLAPPPAGAGGRDGAPFPPGREGRGPLDAAGDAEAEATTGADDSADADEVPSAITLGALVAAAATVEPTWAAEGTGGGVP